MHAGTTKKTASRFAKRGVALLLTAALAVTPLLSGCATDAAVDDDASPLADTAATYGEAESTSVSASDTLTIIAGAAVPETPGSTTYKFPTLRVESNTTRLIKSITIQFTTAVTSSDSITLGTASGFTLWSGNKSVNRSVNANGNGATAKEWEAYLRENLSVTLAGDGTKGLRMIASFEKVDRTLDYNSLNGHYYETVKTNVNWEKAFEEAKKKSYMGMRGYLVTVTSVEEHNYVYTMIGTNCWMGLTCWDAYTNPVKNTYADFYKSKGITIPASTYESNRTTPWYFWVDGPEAGKLATKGGLGSQVAVADPDGGTMYSNWSSGEPNNSGSEFCAHFYSSQSGRWNDFANTNQCQYVIEYGGLEGDDNPTDTVSVDAKVDVDVDVYVKVDIKIDPKGKTLSTEAANTTVGTKPNIYESVNGNTEIKTKVNGVEQDAEITRTFYVKDPGAPGADAQGWRQLADSELQDGYPFHAGTYKVTSNAVSEIDAAGKATPYAAGESQFTIKPKVLDPAKDFVDSESGKTLAELGGTMTLEGTGEGDGSGDGSDDGTATDDGWAIDDKTPVPVSNGEGAAPMGKDAIASDIEERYGEVEGFPVGGEPAITITRHGADGAKEPVDAIDPTVPGTYVVEAVYPQPDGTEKKVRTVYTVAGPDGNVPGIEAIGGEGDNAVAEEPTLGVFNKVFDGTDSFDLSRLTFPGLEGADVRLVADGAAYDSISAGACKLILTGVHLEGADAGDYAIPGLVDGVLTLDAYIAPRELIITARSTVTFGAAHAALRDGAGSLAELQCDEDVHDVEGTPWLVNMLAPEDAERVGAIIESILGDATYTALREGDELELDVTSPEAGLYTVAVHFDNINPLGGAAPAPTEGDTAGGDEGTPESEGDEPETTPAAFMASAAKGLGLVSTAYADEPEDEGDAADAAPAPGGHAAPMQVVPLAENRFDLGDYILTLREGKVLVTDDATSDTRLDEIGDVVADDTDTVTADPAGTPMGPEDIKKLIDEKWGDKVPADVEPTITITRDGDEVDAIDPTVPGTYTVVAVYPDPEGGPDKIVRYTYVVEPPEPDPAANWPTGDDGWTIDGKDDPMPFDPSRGPLDKDDVAGDIDERYGDHPDFPSDGKLTGMRITHIAPDGTQRTVDLVDPNVPGTYIVEAEYTMPDGTKRYVRTSYEVPDTSGSGGPQAQPGDGGYSGGDAGSGGYSGGYAYNEGAGDGRTTVIGTGADNSAVGRVLKLAQTGDALALGAIAGVVLVAGAVLVVAVIRMRNRKEDPSGR